MTSITILICLYFSINSFIAGREDYWNEGENLLFRAFVVLSNVVGALPLALLYLSWELSKELWIWFSNKTGAGFYWKFYILKEFDNLTQKELENVEYRKDNMINNPRVKKWGEKILKHNNYSKQP